MRKCIFILVFFLSWSVFSESGEILKYKSRRSAALEKSSAPCCSAIFLPRKIAVYSGVKFKSDKEQQSYSANLGAQFLFRDFELKAAYKIPETLFAENPEKTEAVFGTRFSFNKIAKIPIEIKAGNLTLGGSFRILKNPALSGSTYALSALPCKAKGISVTLPSFSGYRNPYAASMCINISNKNFLKSFYASCFYNEKDVFAASLSTSFYAGKKNIIGFSGTAARTPLNRKESLRLDGNLFSSSGRKWNFCAQSSLSSEYCGAKLSVCFFENPKTSWGKTYSFENFIKAGFFLLNASAFYAPDKNTLTASLTKQKTLLQFKLNPQGTFSFAGDKVIVKTGISVLAEEKLKTVKRKTFTAKSGAALRVDYSVFSAKLNFKAENIYLSGSLKSFAARGIEADGEKVFGAASYTLSASFLQKAGLYPFCAVSAIFTPHGKNNLFISQYKADASIKLPALVHGDCGLKLSCGYSAKICGDEIEKSSVNIKIAQNFRAGRIFVGGSIGIVYSFD